MADENIDNQQLRGNSNASVNFVLVSRVKSFASGMVSIGFADNVWVSFQLFDTETEFPADRTRLYKYDNIECSDETDLSSLEGQSIVGCRMYSYNDGNLTYEDITCTISGEDGIFRVNGNYTVTITGYEKHAELPKVKVVVVNNTGIDAWSTGEIALQLNNNLSVLMYLEGFTAGASTNLFRFRAGTTSESYVTKCKLEGGEASAFEGVGIRQCLMATKTKTGYTKYAITCSISGNDGKFNTGEEYIYTITISEYDDPYASEEPDTVEEGEDVQINVELLNASKYDVEASGELILMTMGYKSEIHVTLFEYTGGNQVLPRGDSSEVGYHGTFINRLCKYKNGNTVKTDSRVLDEHTTIAYCKLTTKVGDKLSTEYIGCDIAGENNRIVNGGWYTVTISDYSVPPSGSDDSSDSGDDTTPDSGDIDIDVDALSLTTAISIPVIKATIPASMAKALYEAGYRKARAVVVYPEPHDRKILCQGVATPTVYTDNHRGVTVGDELTKDLYAQSSWFFRPKQEVTNYQQDTNSPISGEDTALEYMGNDNNLSPEYIKRVEIQGHYKEGNKFKVDWDTLTYHSPDIEFEGSMQSVDYTSGSLGYTMVGNAKFTKTLSDIDIQTETPAISDKGAGFIKKTFVRDSSAGIISGLFWDDYAVDENRENQQGAPWYFEAFINQGASAKWMVYLWNKSGSLNNDIERPADKGVRSAVLKQKIISNLRYAKTSFLDAEPFYFYSHLFNSDVSDMIKLKQVNVSYSNMYKGNVDTMLSPDDSDGMYFALHYELNQIKSFWDPASFTYPIEWKTFGVYNSDGSLIDKGIYKYSGNWNISNDSFGLNIGDGYTDLVRQKSGIRMKYKSTPHLVLESTKPGSIYGGFSNHGLADDSLPVLELGRTIKDETNVLFGGRSDDAFKDNVWIPCGEPVALREPDSSDADEAFNDVEIEYSWGDAYYQRYDCLKTYAYTPEDINQVVEIGSFMLETYVNIDGRYDRNRGQGSNLYMSPRNFNLLNPVYSQLNNFFSYRILDKDAYERKYYPNQVTWSKTKTSGADVDLWTNVTLASVMELDGDKNRIRKLIRLNDQLLCFQDSGISQILYNDNVQISATNGTPIEIANSGKVSGKRYLSDSVGCSNKWSIAQTPAGIYFMDAYNKGIFLFNGQLNNLSTTLGFNTWSKNSIPSQDVDWTPVEFNNFVSHYDKLNQDVLFINSDTALAYSEKFGVFTSFYDYEHTPYLCNVLDSGVWVRNDLQENSHIVNLWKHNGGEYCSFFGEEKPYWMTLVGNPEPQMDKIFTNLEFRACVDGDGELQNQAGKFAFTLPFDFLETWDEYQHGYTELSERQGHSAMLHHTQDNISSLKRKFRMWRCDIPRNNALLDSERTGDTPYSTDAELGISRHIRKPNDRMRNPWLYLKLMKKENASNRTEVHDLLMTYFV